MDIKPCQPYNSRVDGRALLRLPLGPSAFKIYYVSIPGRDNPGRCDWAHSQLKKPDFEAALAKLAPEGVGFVTAFPHITKIFRFAPSGETILHVKAYKTPGLEPLDLGRPDGYLEFACYAEAELARDEYARWASAATVEDYLAWFSPFAGGGIADHTKLAGWARGA
ncbi:MAG: hypothetical protein A2X32_04250 [Elusimicrobia bacterium GWC2_64_44]|nr:MAG: hypothetical protein A2X32_04250 [Elusimicrobia bacterium GWC2_64_44]